MSVNRAAATRTIGELCVGGDWACANGDLETLGHLARELARYAREPLHCELVVLADMCRDDPDQAVSTWMRLKELLLGEHHARP